MKNDFEYTKFRITACSNNCVKENPRGMKSASNKREIRVSAGSKNRESTVRVLKNFAKFTGKQLCWSLFLMKLFFLIKTLGLQLIKN